MEVRATFITSMKPLPRRHSLIDETASVLRQRLDGGEWSLYLPGEIELASLLQVGRNTMRAALAILEEEGRISTTKGSRREIAGGKEGKPKGKEAVLLMSKPEREFPPATARWIEETCARLESEGWTFRVLVDPGIYRGKPEGRLASLVHSLPGSVWILHRSTPAMQRWFQEEGERTILAGSRHEGIQLPQVEIDYRAVSRHAAGRFLSRGHRRLAILRPEASFAGDAESVAAFREAANRAEEVLDLRCRPGTREVANVLRKVMGRADRPTALYVLHADHCVTALTFLQQEGIAIPRDLSLICREDAPYLEFLVPEPARYRHSTRIFSARLAALVSRHESVGTGKLRSSLIMPSVIEGATLSISPVLK
jgi:hypothetical protein